MNTTRSYKRNICFLTPEKRILAVRLFLIFVIACSLGLFLVKNTSVDQAKLRAFFASLPENKHEFFRRSAATGFTYVSILALASVSTLTFFCPMLLHSLSALCGMVCGIRIGILLSIVDLESQLLIPATVYIVFILIFAVTLSTRSAYFLGVNKSFINEERHSKKHGGIFVSHAFRSWLLHSVTLIISFSAIVAIFCVIMRILI